MKTFFSALLLVGSVAIAQDAAPNTPQPDNNPPKHIQSIKTQDNTMKQAQEMIKKAMFDLRKHDTSDVHSTVILQGNNRSYSAPFYHLVKETIIGELSKLEHIKINFTAPLPRVTIKGTPTSLHIARANEKDIEKIALKSGAQTIFLWNLFEHDGEMNFIARIINTESKAIMWHYKVNKEYIKNDKLLQAQIIKYSIPDDYYMAVGFSTFFWFSPYTRTGVAAANTQTANWILGYNLLYSTQSSVSPRLRLGAGFNYIASGEPALPFSMYNLYVDVRYQINEFIPPLYDSATGEILQRRNHQALMIGATFGRTEAFADKQSSGGNYSLYANLGISKAIEVNLGVTGYLSAALKYDSSALYSNDTVSLGWFNMFFNLNYKFDFENIQVDEGQEK